MRETAMGRRKAMLGAAVVAAGAGVAAPAIAAPQHPDAAVISGWDRFERIEWQRLALFVGPGRIDDDDERNVAIAPLWAAQDEIAEAMSDRPPTTMEGHRARARAVVLSQPDLICDEHPIAGDLMADMLIDLVGEEWLGRLIRHFDDAHVQSAQSLPPNPPPQPGEQGYIPELAQWRADIHAAFVDDHARKVTNRPVFWSCRGLPRHPTA